MFWYIDIPDISESYGTSFDFIAFFGHFHTTLATIYVWSIVPSPNFHRLCVWLIYTFWYVIMPNVTAGYGRFANVIAFFENFYTLLIFNKLYAWSLNIIILCQTYFYAMEGKNAMIYIYSYDSSIVFDTLNQKVWQVPLHCATVMSFWMFALDEKKAL